MYTVQALSWLSTDQVHHDDVIMGAIASPITSLTIVYSTVYSDADQRKHQSSAALAFVSGSHRGPVNSPHKWPVTRKMFPFDDVIMLSIFLGLFHWHLGQPYDCPVRARGATWIGSGKYVNSGSANAQLPGCFCPWTFSLNILEYWIEHVSFGILYVMFTFPTRIFYWGSSRLCNWLSLRRLVPWINHLPPVCWSTFWKSSLKW